MHNKYYHVCERFTGFSRFTENRHNSSAACIMRVISLLCVNASLVFHVSLIILPRLAARKHILTDSIGYHPYLMDNRELTAAKLCDLMLLQKKQRRICRRDRGVAQTLYESTELAKFECDRQFRRERWNCSLAEKYRLNILKKGKFILPFMH